MIVIKKYIFLMQSYVMNKPILLYDVIYNESSKEITDQILAASPQEPIEMWINSPGGSITSGWSILTALKQHESDINMTVVGDASSMAFIMLAFADKVTAYDTSNFLVHRAATWWEGDLTEAERNDLENRNKIIRAKLEKRINTDVFEKVTGKTFDEIFSMNDRLDVYLTAKQAKKIGLVDNVIKLDVKERNKIEAKYYNEILALSNNTNKSKPRDMSIISAIFGEKDSIMLAKIGDTQFAYNKLEVGAKVKAVGENIESISGAFEAKEKHITVVDNEITAVENVDTKGKEIEALKSELKAIKESQISIDDIKEVVAELQKNYNEKIEAINKTLTAAKLSVSKPKLPEGKFKEEEPQVVLTVREKLALAQKQAYENNIKNKEE